MAVDQRLIEYISQNLNSGYDQNSIVQALLSSGYSQKQINAAFDYLYAQSHYGSQPRSQYIRGGYTAKSFFTSPLFIIVAIIGISIIGILLFLLFSLNQSSEEFEISPSPNQQIPTTPPSQTPRDDVEIDDVSPLPENESAQQNNETDSVSPTTPTQTNRPTQTQTSTGLESTNPTRAEIDRTVNQIAGSQPERAIGLCEQISTSSGRSSCYTRVAVASKIATYCEKIDDIYPKDQCYMQFAIEEIGSIQTICPNIHDKFMQRSCTLLYQSASGARSQETVIEPPLSQDSDVENRTVSDEDPFIIE